MLKRLMAVGAAAVAVAVISAAGLATTTGTTGKAGSDGLSKSLGAGDFRNYCAACHGVGAKGDGTVAEFLTIAAADLTQLKKKNAGIFPRERVIEVIDGRAEVKVHGPRDMPVWGDWFNAEAADSDTGKAAREAVISARINALADYIESLQE